MGKRAVGYGVVLALATLVLQWLDYQRIARVHTEEVYIVLIAAAFLAMGIFIGLRLVTAPPPQAADGTGNPQATAALNISERELQVLLEIAGGRSNKEIAARLQVSPNTIKTHVARLFEKLGARRRTEAILKARELGIVP